MDSMMLFYIIMIVSLGAYFQTVTGFGLGIIVIGLTVSFDFASIAFIAVVVSIVTLFNCVTALIGKDVCLEKTLTILLVLGIVPGVIAGVWLLNYLSDSARDIMQACLGMMILISGGYLMVKTSTRSERSHASTFLLSGVGAGLTGGLFGMAGPPLVYHLYRQPVPLEVIKTTLLAVFACTSASRTAFVFLTGGIDFKTLLVSLTCIPVVIFTTLIAKRFPPPLNVQQLRRGIFGLLALIGIYLITSASKAMFSFD